MIGVRAPIIRPVAGRCPGHAGLTPRDGMTPGRIEGFGVRAPNPALGGIALTSYAAMAEATIDAAQRDPQPA